MTSRCAAATSSLEQLVITLEEQLGTTVDDPIEVYLWGQANPDPPDWCENEVLGCYSPSRGKTFTSEHSVDHELVYAVIDTFGDPADIWNEGAAESLSFERTYRSSSPPSASLDTEDPNYSTALHARSGLLPPAVLVVADRQKLLSSITLPQRLG